MSTTADVIVIGVGGMGSAACYHLAARGASVIGIDAHPPGHSLGRFRRNRRPSGVTSYQFQVFGVVRV